MAERRVCVLYTGGTIGMVEGASGYEPVRGFLERRLAANPTFHVPGRPALTLPASRFDRHVHYEIIEFDPLKDSSNMGREDWVGLAVAIAQRDADWDAFVVLHGTDTMAYTASALSFMLQGLEKTVVVTGSQIPLARTRNDAVDNLLGALMVAGHYDIPEVGIYFDDKLLRGNRARKVDAAGLDAFRSGNLRPLVEVGVQVDVRWDLVLTPSGEGLRVRPITNPHVVPLRLFPGLTAPTLARLLAPPLEGLVLETYGAGNAPDARPGLLRVLRDATDRGVVIVNVTQCHRGGVGTAYAAGRALADCGVVPGGDMTAEAALTKLQWLLSLDLPVEAIRDRVGRSLRGELTEPDPSPRFSWRG